MKTTRTLAVALIGSAALAGPAAAMPTDAPHQPALPPVVRAASHSDVPSSGFDWSSAGIGAAGGIGAFAIALAAADGVRRRHAEPA